MLVLQAWRSWRHAKGVGLLAATALAAGIGAATAIYTVVNAVMLKPLPYRDGGRFVALFSAATDDPVHYGSLSYKDAESFRDRTASFDAFGWFRESGKNLVFAGEPLHIQGVRVTPEFVRQLGVDPSLGQWFRDASGAVISNALWRRFGADPQVVGKPITLDGVTYTVTGVMPPAFRLPVAGIISAGQHTDVWLALEREEIGAAYIAYARRKPGVSLAAADADVKRVAAQIAREDPGTHPAFTARLYDLRETIVHDIRPTLLLLFGAAALLFLITCANAAGLLLARSVARARETAMRVALGATRRQLAAQYVLESLPVSLAAAIGGLILSATLTPIVVALAADYLPHAEDVALDWTVLAFALGTAFVAAVLSSLAPLWQAMRTAPSDALGEGARSSAGARSRRVSQALVVMEIALAFALLAVGSVLLTHVRGLARIPLGLDADHLLTFVLSIPGPIAADEHKRLPLQRRLVDTLAAIPGVEQVAFANQLPIQGCCMGAPIYAEGRDAANAGQRTSLMATTPEYFAAMRIPLRQGRFLTDRDAVEPIAAVISETAAARYWAGVNPVGAYGTLNRPGGSRFRVVGVVGDVRNDGPGNPPVPDVYLPAQLLQMETMCFVVRSQRSTASLLPDVRRAIHSIDPQQPIHDVATMRDIVGETMTLERTASFLTTFFAASALLLAMLGIYGVVSYSVRQRTVEIGTRVALGATSGRIASMVVGAGLRMAAVGVIVGAAAAIAAAAPLRGVFEIGAIGPLPFLYSGAIVGLVASAASAVPGWRASLLSPMVAIRNDPSTMWRVAAGVRRMLRGSQHPAEAAVPLGSLIADFADVTRRSASFHEASEVALATLRAAAGSESIALLRRTSSGDYVWDGGSIPGDGFLVRRLRRYSHALPLTQGDFDAWLRWAQPFRPQHAAELEQLARVGARLAVPLRIKEDIVGVLLLGGPAGRQAYNDAERETLTRSADVLALIIENARLGERALEQERLRRDLAVAAEVQKRLLPPQPPRSPAATFAALTLPARTVGGDYYDFVDLGDERLGIAIADVSGKGIAAALLMSVVQASLRVISSSGTVTPSQLAARMNRFLYDSTGANKYATFFYAELDACGRHLRYVNAGHNPPYLVRRTDGAVEVAELAAGGTVIGLFPDMAYEEAAVELHEGDLLVAFTDGVPEALDAAGAEFGEERVKDLLRQSAGRRADEVASALAATMREWIGTAEQYDDLTFVVMSLNG